MEYTCKNSKKAKPVTFFLGDSTMRIRCEGMEELIHYADVKSVWINKSGRAYSVLILCADRYQYILSNRYIHSSGQIEDKSNAYALFVRVLHMHLRDKSKASITCIKKHAMPGWQKYLWVPVAFSIAFALNYLGFNLFHWALQGIALAAIGLLLIIVSERNRAEEKSASGDIPLDFLPS